MKKAVFLGIAVVILAACAPNSYKVTRTGVDGSQATLEIRSFRKFNKLHVVYNRDTGAFEVDAEGVQRDEFLAERALSRAIIALSGAQPEED